MYFWNSLPLFRLIIPFILGVVFSDEIYFDEIMCLNLMVLFALILVQILKMSYSLRWLFGALASLLMFGAGAWLYQNTLDFSQEQYFVNFLEEENTLFLELIEEPQSKANSFKVLAEVYAVDDKLTEGVVLIYFDKEIDSLHYGKRLITTNNPREVDAPSNPFQFNYRQFLFYKSISHQLYLSKTDLVVLDEEGGATFKKYIINFRLKLLSLFNKKDFSEDEVAISSALLLGYKQDMSLDIKQAFSNTGVVHILAVSGLHVGIIYLLLNVVFSFMDKSIALRVIKLLIVLFSLWVYAFLTVLSPSVMRAATMFSFLAVGSALNRSTNIYNTLAASAFVLLLINPHFIYEVGFQLSYLAVLGIVMIYPKLYELIQFKFSWIDYFWKLFCVSMAAQLITFPLSIYYFHQFPNYFFVANLMVVPLVPLIIYSGLGFLLFNELLFFSEAFSFALQFFIQALLKVVGWIEQWPYSISDFLFLDQRDVILIYAIIGALLLAIYLRKKIWINVSLLLLLTVQFKQIALERKQAVNKEIVFYSVYRHTVLGLVSNGEGTFFMNEELLTDPAKQSFNFYNHWAYLGINNLNLIKLDTNIEHSMVWKKDQHIQLANARILWVNDNFKPKFADSPVQVDYCLISSHCTIEQLIKSYRFKHIVLDAALPKYIARRLSNECQELNLAYHDLNTQGALVVDLNN
jgi:competence protein ComEC